MKFTKEDQSEQVKEGCGKEESLNFPVRDVRTLEDYQETRIFSGLEGEGVFCCYIWTIRRSQEKMANKMEGLDKRDSVGREESKMIHVYCSFLSRTFTKCSYLKMCVGEE